MSIHLKNLIQVQKALIAKGKTIEQSVSKEVQRAGLKIEGDARSKAGVISPDIRINGDRDNLSYTIQATFNGNPDIAAYIEFGTGSYAAATVGKYPQDIKDLAMRFYKNGLGRLPARPYLMPTYLIERKKFVENIKKIISKI